MRDPARQIENKLGPPHSRVVIYIFSSQQQIIGSAIIFPATRLHQMHIRRNQYSIAIRKAQKSQLFKAIRCENRNQHLVNKEATLFLQNPSAVGIPKSCQDYPQLMAPEVRKEVVAQLASCSRGINRQGLQLMSRLGRYGIVSEQFFEKSIAEGAKWSKAYEKMQLVVDQHGCFTFDLLTQQGQHSKQLLGQYLNYWARHLSASDIHYYHHLEIIIKAYVSTFSSITSLSSSSQVTSSQVTSSQVTSSQVTSSQVTSSSIPSSQMRSHKYEREQIALVGALLSVLTPYSQMEVCSSDIEIIKLQELYKWFIYKVTPMCRERLATNAPRTCEFLSILPVLFHQHPSLSADCSLLGFLNACLKQKQEDVLGEAMRVMDQLLEVNRQIEEQAVMQIVPSLVRIYFDFNNLQLPALILLQNLSPLAERAYEAIDYFAMVQEVHQSAQKDLVEFLICLLHYYPHNKPIAQSLRLGVENAIQFPQVEDLRKLLQSAGETRN